MQHLLAFADERQMNEALENGQKGGTPVPLRLARLAAHPTAAAAAFRGSVLKQPPAAPWTVGGKSSGWTRNFTLTQSVPSARPTARRLRWKLPPSKEIFVAAGPLCLQPGLHSPGRLCAGGAAAGSTVFVTPQALARLRQAHRWPRGGKRYHVLGFPTLLPRVMEPVEHDDIQCVFCGSLHPGMREPGFALALFRALHDDAVTLTMAGGGWERFAADADETARGVRSLCAPACCRPKAAALEDRADVLSAWATPMTIRCPASCLAILPPASRYCIWL